MKRLERQSLFPNQHRLINLSITTPKEIQPDGSQNRVAPQIPEAGLKLDTRSPKN